ncbi:ferritin-like domain-containing protein [Mesorhizobium sp. M0166]|uniref:ferritin-like domain-containing protein n=1 Tax=Mesorhizobium sp. M0166 TaxID=2956902 RepID=UPI003339C0E1
MANNQGYSRRHVLRWGAAATTVMVAGAMLPNFGISTALAADLGEGDIGILNYAYALEQLEAAFYTTINDKPFHGITQHEAETFAEIRDHEVAHREFFKKALGESAIPEIEVDFSKVNFGSRAAVLGAADAFENLGVSAYNGAGQLIKKVDYLVAAGTIVSVEARHAAMIAALLHGPSAASAGGSHISPQGLDGEMSPEMVLGRAKPFIKTQLNFKSPV